MEFEQQKPTYSQLGKYINEQEKQGEILTDFLTNCLIEYEQVFSTAFIHRCYLNHSKKKYHTQSMENVIKDRKQFKDMLVKVAGKYEVIDKLTNRSKGWKLAVLKD